MGEWGAFYTADSTIVSEAAFILKTMNDMQCGNFYWSYQYDLRKRSYFPVLFHQKNNE